MTTDDQIKYVKLKYDINRDAAKLSTLLSGEVDKYEYLTGEEILPSNQWQIIEQAKFAYSLLEKAFEIQIAKRNQFSAIKSLKPNKKDKLKKIRVYFHKILSKI